MLEENRLKHMQRDRILHALIDYMKNKYNYLHKIYLKKKNTHILYRQYSFKCIIEIEYLLLKKKKIYIVTP